MSYLAKIKELGYELPVVPTPVAAYVPAVRTGNLIMTSGALPIKNGELLYKGKLDGVAITEEMGYEAAKLCILNGLSIINDAVGLDNVEQIVKITGFVASAEGFTNQPKVVNGASELLVAIFGKNGEHARSAVGVAELPLNASVEIEMIVQVKE